MASGEQGPLDNFYANNKAVVIFLSVCCGIIGLVLNLVAFFTAKNPESKATAKLGLIINVVMFVVGIILNFVGLGAAIMGAGAAK